MSSIEARAARTAAKKVQRSRREAELGARQRALPDKRYGVILADPPWRFEPWSRETGMDRSADNHYPTSPLGAIMALGVASIAAPDSVLFLWATVPMLPQAIEVLVAWGFAYKSSFVWVKDRAGAATSSGNVRQITAQVLTGAEPPDQMAELLRLLGEDQSAQPAMFSGGTQRGRQNWAKVGDEGSA